MIDPHAETPSANLSRDLSNAITRALREEKQSYAVRLLKILCSSLIGTFLLSAPLFLLFRGQLTFAWQGAIVIWWLLLLAGFYLYYLPQPRLSVPGYWSPWIFARLLIAMTVLTVVEILVCPSFVFLASPHNWSPFEPLTRFFMSMGGMHACMFACGFIFASLGGLVTFATVARTLKRAQLADLSKAAILAYLSQLPVIFIQMWDPALRTFVGSWIMGSALGLLSAALLVRSVAKRIQRS